MKQKIWFAYFCFGICANFGIAQMTVTTTGGTQNKLPKFSGNSVISDSAITEANGNVGIGTISPASLFSVGSGSQFQVNSGGQVTMYVPDANAYAGLSLYGAANSYFMDVNNNGIWDPSGLAWNGLAIGTGTDYPVRFATNSLTRMTILADGNVGIGTTSPGTKLQLSLSDTNSYDGFSILGAANSYFMDVNNSNIWDSTTWSGLAIGTGTNYPIKFATNSAVRMTIANSGNVGIGTTAPSAKLEVNGGIKLSGVGSSITFPNGEVQSVAWNGTLCGGDYAESVDVSGDRRGYEPGDVLVVSDGDSADVAISSHPYSALVVGVYSTKPGVLGRRQTGEKSAKEIPMAMVGIVPVKVSAENGSIKKGDPLVTASVPGYAMKGTERDRMFNAVLGKALGSIESGTGVIEAFISLQ